MKLHNAARIVHIRITCPWAQIHVSFILCSQILPAIASFLLRVSSNPELLQTQVVTQGAVFMALPERSIWDCENFFHVSGGESHDDDDCTSEPSSQSSDVILKALACPFQTFYSPHPRKFQRAFLIYLILMSCCTEWGKASRATRPLCRIWTTSLPCGRYMLLRVLQLLVPTFSM